MIGSLLIALSLFLTALIPLHWDEISETGLFMSAPGSGLSQSSSSQLLLDSDEISGSELDKNKLKVSGSDNTNSIRR